MLIEGAVLFELHKLCATFSASVNINYRLPIKVYYHICTLRHQNRNKSWKPECVLSFNMDISKFYPSLLARDKILISANPC